MPPSSANFSERGLDRTTEPDTAGIVVLNTCTVTAAADQDARAAIRRIHRKNPKAQIVVTGCYAQRAPEEIAALSGVTSVIGNSHKHRLAEISLLEPQTSDGRSWSTQSGFIPLTRLTSAVEGPRSHVRSPIFVSDIFAHTELQAAPVFDARQRTHAPQSQSAGWLRQPVLLLRYPLRSRTEPLPADGRRSFARSNALVAAGYREVVISGINLGRWGRDLVVRPRLAPGESQPLLSNDHGLCFEDLVRAILSETTLQKLRISSVEPMDWSDELIQLMATSPRIAKHAHVPLQSGSDAVLRRMHRKYRPWHYREKIEKIRAAMPHAAIGADVMAGFPGESEAEFEETRRLVEDLPFTYLHVFTYSARPGTPAAAMAEQVPIHLARERNRILRDLASEKQLAFLHTFGGKAVEAITLNLTGSNRGVEYTEGLTDNYLPIRLKGNHPPNRWITANVETVSDGALVGIAG